MKRNNIRTLFYGGLLSLCCVGMTSCEDYLDKAPESSVNPEDAFKISGIFRALRKNCITVFLILHMATGTTHSTGEKMNLSLLVSTIIWDTRLIWEISGAGSQAMMAGNVAGWTVAIRWLTLLTVCKNLYGHWHGMVFVNVI